MFKRAFNNTVKRGLMGGSVEGGAAVQVGRDANVEGTFTDPFGPFPLCEKPS